MSRPIPLDTQALAFPKKMITAGMGEAGEKVWREAVANWAAKGFVLHEDGTVTRKDDPKP